jgi:hypothetical protein
VFRVPVSQQQAADEADRFALRFGASERATPTAVHLYRLRFDLEADGSGTRIPAGTAVVTLPLSLREGDGYFWSEIYDSGKVQIDPAPGTDRILTCMRTKQQNHTTGPRLRRRALTRPCQGQAHPPLTWS